MTPLERALERIAAVSPFGFELDRRGVLALDLSAANPALQAFDPLDTARFCAWIDAQMRGAGVDCAVGGYAEDRALYRTSPLFRQADGRWRTIHLGVDLWAPAGTDVHAVIDGRVHSCADNAAFGDYGPTLVFAHEFEGLRFHTLYGHLSRNTLGALRPGQAVSAGQRIATLGAPDENVGWPPHLHLQIVVDLDGRSGDYPGVCCADERDRWLANCPDPNLLLRLAALSPARP
jgi:murein DD-endopeptidase MepM/ murein hydrolase activator NlpD